MKIVILGYTGLLGRNILKNLVKKTSLNLVCVGRNIKRQPYKMKRVKYFKWDFVSFKNSNLLFFKNANFIINCVGKTNKNLNSLQYENVDFIKKLLKYIINYKKKIRLIHLSSVSVYGGIKHYLGKNKVIKENTIIKTDNTYSKSKFKGDMLIKNIVRKKLNKNFSYTILRISNVFGEKENSNLYSFVLFLFKSGIWIRSSNEITYNFINVKDVSEVVRLIVIKSKVSMNKTYIVSDDCKQYEIFDIYQKKYRKKILNIFFPTILIKLFINFVPMPIKLYNFLSIISSKITYSNDKIRKDLNFNPKFSLIKKI